MKFRMQSLTAALAAVALTTGPATAQYYGDDDPVRGNYEYEPDQGYHEEEWYDPSDWFDGDDTVSYETDNWNWGWGNDDSAHYDDLGYDYDYGYTGYDDDFNESPYMDRYDMDTSDQSASNIYTYDDRYSQSGRQSNMNRGQQSQQRYGQQFDQQQRGQAMGQQRSSQMNRQQRQQQAYGQQTRQQNQQSQRRQSINGEVVGLQRVSSNSGAPDTVVLKVRTDDGQTRNLLLGDMSYAQQNLPRLQQGDRIAIGGQMVQSANGRQLFKARDIASRTGNYQIPEYGFQRTIRGKLTGLRQIALEDGNVQALVARVQNPRGETINVLLGDRQALQKARTLRPGDDVHVQGYRRSVGGQNTFVVQGVNIRNSQSGNQPQSSMQQQRSNGQNRQSRGNSQMR